MTPLQKLTLRASEVRSRLAVIGGMSDLTDEIRSELETLKNEYADLETRQQALTIAGDVPPEPETRNTSEGRDIRALLRAGNLGDMFDNIVAGQHYTGANDEIRSHYELAHNQIPLAMLRDMDALDALETRGTTTAPSDVQGNQHEILTPVFPQSALAFLGIAQPSVPTGDSIYPILTTRATAGGPHKDSTIVGESDGTFTATTLAPERIQASFIWRRTDAARFGGMSEALRMNMSDALSDKLDIEALTGTNGLLTGTNLDNHNVSTETTYALYRSQFLFDRIDGRYAATTGEVRALMGSATFAHAASQYRGNNDNMDALMSLTEQGGGVRVSANVAAASGTPAKQNALIRVGSRMDAVLPIWTGITVIPDEISLADKGELQATAVMLMAFRLLRSDGFRKQQTQHA